MDSCGHSSSFATGCSGFVNKKEYQRYYEEIHATSCAISPPISDNEQGTPVTEIVRAYKASTENKESEPGAVIINGNYENFTDADLTKLIPKSSSSLLSYEYSTTSPPVRLRNNRFYTGLPPQKDEDPPHPEVVKHYRYIFEDAFQSLAMNVNTNFFYGVSMLIPAEGNAHSVPIHSDCLTAHSEYFRSLIGRKKGFFGINLVNYTEKVLKMLVQLLYRGYFYYNKGEEKEVTLCLEALRQIKVEFNEGSMFSHELKRELIAIKQEEPDRENEPAVHEPEEENPFIVDKAEVDQVENHIYKLDSNVSSQRSKAAKDKNFSYVKQLKMVDPNDPGRNLNVRYVLGQGSRLQKLVPENTLDAESVLQQQKLEDAKKMEELFKRKQEVIDIEDANEKDEQASEPPSKKKKVSIFEDGRHCISLPLPQDIVEYMATIPPSSFEFQISGSGLLIIKKNPENQPNGEPTSLLTSNDELLPTVSCEQENPQASETPILEKISPIVIPPSKPNRTGIAIMGKRSPGNVRIMPKLTPVAEQASSRGVYQPNERDNVEADNTDESDLTGIPELKKVINNSPEKHSSKKIEEILHNPIDKSPPSSAPVVHAAVIPKEKFNLVSKKYVNQGKKDATRTGFVDDEKPSTSAALASELERNKNKTLLMESHKKCASVVPPVDPKMNPMKEDSERQQFGKKKIVVMGSKKVRAPMDVKIDLYVSENSDNDYEGDTESEPPGYIHKIKRYSGPNHNSNPPPAVPEVQDMSRRRGERREQRNDNNPPSPSLSNTEVTGTKTKVRGRGRGRGGSRGRSVPRSGETDPGAGGTNNPRNTTRQNTAADSGETRGGRSGRGTYPTRKSKRTRNETQR